MPFTWPVRVRFVDTDASYRIHYTAMLRHFEAAEIEFFRSLGRERKDVSTAAVNFPRVHVECTYTAFVQFDDLLEIAVRVERIGRTSYTLRFDAGIESRPVAHGSVTAVCVERSTRRSHPMPPELVDMLKKAQAADAIG
ncbi:MAG TPA: thioesterase family protein [Bryobacteraceae bacterium]|nr:thioesterase family protein [Bryobacteraceae bacterium]